MTAYGNVQITLIDGGSANVVVPGSSTQLVIGCSTAGTVGQVVATRSPGTLQSTFSYGPLPEAAALPALKGGTILAMRATTVTKGAVRSSSAVNVSTTTGNAVNPIVVTTSTPHGLATGDVVTIASVVGNTNANGTFDITVTGASTFTIPVTGNGAYVSGGTVTWGGVVYTGTGTSVVTVTVDGTNGSFDEYYVQVSFATNGTIGVAGILFQVSLDAGRNFGPVLALGTANTYAIPNTGVTLNFAAGTVVANDFVRFSTTAPIWNTAGLSVCLNNFLNSPYGGSGIGSIHIVGQCSGADASAIDGFLTTLANGYLFSRAFVTARDASPPAAWGGTGETEATWQAAIGTDYSAVSAKRICPSGGFYNMPSAYPSATAGAPRYRRPLSWALAARQVTVPPQRHLGRVRDGALANIVVSPTTDPNDGFIYHDEAINPGLDYLITGAGTNRFAAAMTRKPNLPGFYNTNPLLASPIGSDFFMMPLGSVMDVACGIVHQVGQLQINDDVRLNANGTIYVNDALAIQQAILGALNSNMTSANMISSARVVVDQTNNVASTRLVNITVTIVARGYVLGETISIGFSNPNAQAA